MLDSAYLEVFAATLRSHHNFDRFDPGLTEAEVKTVQRRFSFTFPPDLRTVLQFALPIGRAFPDWRNGSEEDLQFRLSRPMHGIMFDVEHNDDIWPTEWGPRPNSLEERFKTVNKLVESAPRLIPIYAHRYIPAEPTEAGNPVFSVHQTDIIYYGNDLADYFHRKFRVPLPEWAAREPRPIRFWDDSLKWRDRQ